MYILAKDFCGLSDSMTWDEAQDALTEGCVQEKFWMPSPLKEGRFIQLGCACIMQSERTGAHFCPYHRRFESVYYSAPWYTLYNERYTLYDGPVWYETYCMLQDILGINLPLIAYF